MKKVIALAFMLFASSVAYSQKDENFEFLVGNETVGFFVNYKDAKGTKPTDIVFYGALANSDGVFISTFRGNCEEQTVALLAERQVGVPGERVVEKPEARKVSKDSPIEKALKVTCKKRFGEVS